MKFFFDTEFYEDGRIIDLISIGIAAEDGRTYYAEVPDAFEIATRSDWLATNVAPHLALTNLRSRDQIARDIVEFVGDKPEFWAYYADYDWVVLCQLYGRMIDLPESWPMFCRDLRQLQESSNAPKPPKQETAQHNALADAIWVKSAWEYLQDYKFWRVVRI